MEYHGTHTCLQEGGTKIVEVEIADAATLQQALTYLYTGIYDDESLDSIDYIPSETAILLDGPEDEGIATEPHEAIKDRPQNLNNEIAAINSSSSPRFRTESTQPDALYVCHHEEVAPISDHESASRCKCQPLQTNESKLVCNNRKLRANTLVYILADYYQISDLKRLAVSKFASALQGICRDKFDQVCILVYQSAPASALDLRLCLSSTIARSGQQLIEDPAFMKTALILPELMRDAFSNLVRLHKIMSDERDATTAACLEAEDTAKMANERSQEDYLRVITQVNHARSCRHCGLDNNVLFEAEGSVLGRFSHSFRCRCRTRY